MGDKREWERGSVLYRFEIHHEEAAQAIVRGLRAAGYGVDLTPCLITNDGEKPAPGGNIITIYRKVRTYV